MQTFRRGVLVSALAFYFLGGIVNLRTPQPHYPMKLLALVVLILGVTFLEVIVFLGNLIGPKGEPFYEDTANPPSPYEPV